MKDLAGLEYDGQVVLGFSHKNKSHYYWNVKCGCGRIRPVRTEYINKGASKHCGCKTVKNISGMRFGRLTVQSREGSNSLWQAKWRCVCDCGNTIVALGRSLRDGNTTSCGCYRDDQCSAAQYKHGHTGTPLYVVFNSMVSRCNNPSNKSFESYGGRGISVCEEWINSKEKFFEWSMANGYRPDLQIDRIDNNGNYEPSNCRWVTCEENNNNRRSNIFISHLGKTQTIEQWARELNISGSTIQQRLKRGCSVDTCLSTNNLVTGLRLNERKMI